ncbi:hypothetical protein FN976_21660 [Caenimonas sedimenti]|uniref:Uncharacterized protein n=1 Tax=Caenimonas sedimenti TaxID=2596921 RepID=A0A562ZJ70_9BURK|nr:hypothetical protein FN976_21660 [Caenimonas sedimenti]
MGLWKKRMAACNGWHRGSIFALTRKRADFHAVQPSLDGCKSSTEPRRDAFVPSGTGASSKDQLQRGKHENNHRQR